MVSFSFLSYDREQRLPFFAYHFADVNKMVNPKPYNARLVYSCTNRAFFVW